MCYNYTGELKVATALFCTELGQQNRCNACADEPGLLYRLFQLAGNQTCRNDQVGKQHIWAASIGTGQLAVLFEAPCHTAHTPAIRNERAAFLSTCVDCVNSAITP